MEYRISNAQLHKYSYMQFSFPPSLLWNVWDEFLEMSLLA
jgi:hypothetical protein